MPIETLGTLAGDFSPVAAPEARGVAVSDELYRAIMDAGYSSDSGIVVTQRNALTLSAVWSCVDVISSAVAQMPIITYRRLPNGGRERATNHYAYRLLHGQTNDVMTPFRFKRLMQTWVLLDGNAYAELVTNDRYQVTHLLPWRPDRVRVDELRDDVSAMVLPTYVYTLPDGKQIQRPYYMMFHLRGLQTEGLLGLSPIAAHRQTLGMNLALLKHGSKFFKNGAVPRGVLEHPSHLDAKTAAALREEWTKVYGGAENAHKTAVLWEGMKYREVSVKLADAQYLELMKFGVNDVARIYRVPPHKIGDLERSTNNNIEHQGLEFLQDCLGPWLANWEQELQFSLFSEREAQSVYVEFLVNALMRTDVKSRADFYSKGRQWGWFTANEIRAWENLNPVEGGDELLQPLNMVPLGTEQEEVIQNAGTSN